jgi:hypothetical protein
VRSVKDAALGDDDPVTRGRCDELELRAPVDREGSQVAGVEPDHGSVECGGARELLGVVCLDERVEAKLGGHLQQLARLCIVEVAEQEKDCICSIRAGLEEICAIKEEPFGEEREGGRRARGAQIVPGPGEALVHEDGDRRGACALECRCKRGRVGIGSKVACRRGAPFHLGDCAQTGGGEDVAEAAHQAAASFS